MCGRLSVGAALGLWAGYVAVGLVWSIHHPHFKSGQTELVGVRANGTAVLDEESNDTSVCGRLLRAECPIYMRAFGPVIQCAESSITLLLVATLLLCKSASVQSPLPRPKHGSKTAAT